MFVPYAKRAKDCDEFIPPYELKRGGADVCRQHLHIAIPSTPGPHPVFLWAHQNNAVADLPPETLEIITGLGYAVVSWESISKLDNEFDLAIAEMDSRKVVYWLDKNQDNCRLDLSRVVIGGRSRGTVVSWKLAHWGLDNIIGIYMYNALPGRIWDGPDGDTWTEQIKDQSAPIFLSYGPSCPHPINETCVPSPNPDDIHNPKNGAKVIARYNELNLTSYMIDGLSKRPEIDGLGVFYFLPAFVDALETDSFPESMPVLEPKDVYNL